MGRETWTLYSPAAPLGYELTDGWVRDVETREGLYRTPPRRGANGNAGQQHGSEWTPKPYGEGSFQQQVWLMADMGREQLEAWYDELLRVAAWPYDLVRVVRKLADGTERECYAELATSLEPVPLGQQGIRVGLDWTVPSGFWQDTGGDVAQNQAIAGLPTSSYLTFNDLSGGTAPIPASLVVAGPVSAGTRFVQPGTGKQVLFTAAVAADRVVTFNSETGLATMLDTGTAVVTPFREFTYSGRMFMELPPVAAPVDMALRLHYTGAAPGVGSAVALVGTRRWLA